jgi:SpoVK/Ycf46/Vps4 family AAA+-type ATPase
MNNPMDDDSESGLPGLKRFPTTNRSSFPVEELVLRYMVNLLQHSPLCSEFLEMVFSFIGLSVSAHLVSEALRPFIPEKERRQVLREGSIDDLVSAVVRTLVKIKKHGAEVALREGLAGILKTRKSDLPHDCDYRKRTHRLQELLGLSDEDIEVIECFVCYRADRMFENYCDAFPETERVLLLAASLDMPPATVRKRIARDESLMSKGLLSMGRRYLGVDDAVFEYLAGLSEDYISSNDYSVVKQPAFPVESFPVSDKEQHLLVETLCNPAPCHLFFYGRPGTGKTELAKALAAEVGRPAFLVKYRSGGDEQDRRGAITATMGMAPSDAVVIIDEADRLLNTATLFQQKLVDKGWINNFMDECRHKVIWIANETGSIETSVLRRFSYSLEFKKFTTAQRISAWNVQLKNHSLRKVIRPELVNRLARDYEVDAGGIAATLSAADNIFTGQKPDTEKIEKMLGQLLEHHEKLSGVQRKKKKLNRLSSNYDVKALHTDFSATNLIAGLKGGESADHPIAANILFWGLPGTGKTEFAKYIAQELGREMLVKRMSDLQSKFLGETEKRIAEAFDEAGREGAILFLDEADSLILDRKTASRSWESSQTNEVLTQMENFSGICICCTNLLDGLDEAALRRFTWKIKFLPLTPDGAEALFRKYFQPTGRLSVDVKGALRGIHNLTPGDFKTVWQRHQYDGCKPSAIELIQALKQEVSYKRSGSAKPIGFAS